MSCHDPGTGLTALLARISDSGLVALLARISDTGLVALLGRIGDRMFATNDAEATWRDWQIERRNAGLARRYRDARFGRHLDDRSLTLLTR